MNARTFVMTEDAKTGLTPLEWRQTRYLTSDHNGSGNGMIESETLDIEATVARKPEN
jgi:hypothetical protein